MSGTSGVAQVSQPPLRILLLDVEPTGLDPRKDELLALAAVQVEVTGQGSLTRVVDVYSGWRQPARMSRDAESVVGRTRESLKGCSIDFDRLRTMACESHFIVSHNAAFDKLFVYPQAPALRELMWLCSMEEYGEPRAFDGRGVALDVLLMEAGLPVGEGLEDDVLALVSLLARSPVEGPNGFGRLIKRWGELGGLMH